MKSPEYCSYCGGAIREEEWRRLINYGKERCKIECRRCYEFDKEFDKDRLDNEYLA